MRDNHNRLLKIIVGLVLLEIGGFMLFNYLAKNRSHRKGRPRAVRSEDRSGVKPYRTKNILSQELPFWEEEKEGPREDVSAPYQNRCRIDSASGRCKACHKQTTPWDDFRQPSSYSLSAPFWDNADISSGVRLADIAAYDAKRGGFLLKRIDTSLSQDAQIDDDWLSALMVLDRSNMPSDYFQSSEYEMAYRAIDTFYPDIPIWENFSSDEARINFFRFLFTKYAADNKNWRPYEKDISDCTQFSQRIYFFMSPDEALMEDEEYFAFLFSDERNRAERYKKCNKIPNVFYTLLDAYRLKEEDSEQSIPGHAMISFLPDNNPDSLILAEPQTGSFTGIGQNLGCLLKDELTQYPLLCKFGKILTIREDSRHEAEIFPAGSYMFPLSLLTDEESGYSQGEEAYNDIPLNEGDKPIFMDPYTYNLFDHFSFYIRKTLDHEQVNQQDFLQSFEIVMGLGNPSTFQQNYAVGPAFTSVMQGVAGLGSADLELVFTNIDGLAKFSTQQSSYFPNSEGPINVFKYLLQYSLGPYIK